ncbi:MAG: UDP-3-O-(3-hydroxymyristoyl)glucosamine N-acyltransferase [Chloroflexi bacterium HGW-Chloroflexi-1]|nr:MAG: UDP-3-O-(3-hydroxymyristoyl)glucosamine N-acyltransferase [Chloroflexi bacterium HGW-Chloroflexi-1]
MRLSELTGIVPVEVVRDGPISALGFVTHPGNDMLVFLESDRFLAQMLANPRVTGVITTEALAGQLPANVGLALSQNPRRDFYRFHNHLAEHTEFYWHDFPMEIAADAQISPAAHVAEKNVRIGRRTVIEPGVVVLSRTIIGDDVILRAGCVVGSQGFEFNRIGDEILPVAHAGGVRLHDRVEIQANSTISRSIFGGFTELDEDTKLDNLVYVAHNVKIGKRCLLAAHAMIAGSVTIGDDVWIGSGAAISSEITIGDRASITIGSVVTRDVAPGQRVTGNFAVDHDKFIAFLKTIR